MCQIGHYHLCITCFCNWRLSPLILSLIRSQKDSLILNFYVDFWWGSKPWFLRFLCYIIIKMLRRCVAFTWLIKKLWRRKHNKMKASFLLLDHSSHLYFGEEEAWSYKYLNDYRIFKAICQKVNNRIKDYKSKEDFKRVLFEIKEK